MCNFEAHLKSLHQILLISSNLGVTLSDPEAGEVLLLRGTNRPPSKIKPEGNPSSFREWRTGLGLQEQTVEAGLCDLLPEDVLRRLSGKFDS